jgi:hypothetical protein
MSAAPRIFRLPLALLLGTLLSHAETAPPGVEGELSATAAGSCTLDGPAAASVRAGSSRALTAAVRGRRALADRGWYWTGGVQAEDFSFAGGPAWPRRLRDFAAVFSIEYWQGSEIAAALTLRPGFYFETRPVAAAWDVPVELAAGVPLTDSLSGAVGFSNARFFHHAVPIAGFIWTASPRVRVELVWPEPAVIFDFSRDLRLRLGGELSGAGFLSDAHPARTAVEYSSYRVGAELSGAWRPGLRLNLGAGVEAERSFDFFRAQGRFHGGGAPYLRLGLAFSR